MELIIYGIAKWQTERWQEQILSTQCRTQADIARIKNVASKDGWHSFRVATWNGEAPNFAKCVSA